ncbi:riboflavin kinase [Arctopsyche grandis]|uniref:riboflavin kinase n=1 Tax=Arctopsyche grandis TaxID=121162 RepID=UPI00406D9924
MTLDESICQPQEMRLHLPYFTAGRVVEGFGRGSKQLGCPTANFPRSVVETLPKDFIPGVYYGWARVDKQPVYKMVMNIGWCPYYNNEQKSMETHILHEFEDDFYGSQLKICILGYLRPEKNFSSLDDLITEIKSDIKNAGEALDDDNCLQFKTHSFFNEC